MDIKNVYTFRQWLRDHEDRDDAVGELAQWAGKQTDYPKNSEYRYWLSWYNQSRASKSKKKQKERLAYFDLAWTEYLYDVKMKLWKNPN